MFCFKCSGLLENEKCLKCDAKQEQEPNEAAESNYNYSFREPLEIGFWRPNQGVQGIYMMAQVFKKPDQRRRWEGFWIHFYASEHLLPDNKSLKLIHIHFRGQAGEIELYLKDGWPNYRIVKQWGKVSEEYYPLMRKFVRDNYQDIVAKIQKDLKEVGIEWDGTF